MSHQYAFTPEPRHHPLLTPGSRIEIDKLPSLVVDKTHPDVNRSDLMGAKDDMGGKDASKPQEKSIDPVSKGPSIDDFSCPVCFGLAWVPVRLQCQHLFCIRCTVKLQREGKHCCPLCRGDVVMKADTANIDETLIGYLERNFPQEVKRKQRENEVERGKELFGESYEYNKCSVM